MKFLVTCENIGGSWAAKGEQEKKAYFGIEYREGFSKIQIKTTIVETIFACLVLQINFFNKR